MTEKKTVQKTKKKTTSSGEVVLTKEDFLRHYLLSRDTYQTNTPLVINADTPLICPIAAEFF